MKEWLKKMAKELGLAEDASEESVLAALGDKLVSLSGAPAKVRSEMAAQLAVHGLKLDGDKVVKTEGAPSNPADLTRIAALELDSAKTKLASAKTTVESLIAAGKVHPAMKATLEKVFNTTGKIESLSLGKGADGSEVVIKGNVEILEELRNLFNSLPGITGTKLSTLGGQPPKPGEKAPGSLGREIAARQMGKKKEPAAK